MTHANHEGPPEELARRFAGEIRQALRAAGRSSLRCAVTIDGLRLTFGARRARESANDAADLPDALRTARPSTRRVYRALRDLRAELGPGERVTPARIVARLDAEGPDIHSIDTVNHALRDLRDRGAAWSNRRLGWALGREPGSFRHQFREERQR